MIIGGSIALILITTFLIGVKDPNPEWGKFWTARPLLIVPIAGAAGGALYYFMTSLYLKHRWQRTAMTILASIGFVIALWLGTVLGLAGTLWN